MPTLRASQITAVSTIAPQSTLLLADVGAGKTAAGLRAVGKRGMLYGKQRTLVLGTVRICDMVWGTEIQTWLPDYTYASVAGLSAGKRRAILEDESIDIVGLNFENLAWAANEFGTRLAELFPQLIIDESSKLENPGSKSFKAISPILPHFQWRLPMTGTPRSNHLHDLWGNVYLADLGKTLGKYKDAFLQYWFYPVRRSVGIDWIPRGTAETEIFARLEASGVVHRMAFEWQAAVEQDVLIPLNPKVKLIQKKIDAALKIDPDVTIDGITYARNGSRIAAKMFQLSAGYVYTDDREVEVLHFDKLNALAEIIAEAKGEPVMVIYQFDHERDAILERFPQACLLDGNETLAKWNAGKIEILVIHPMSCGHGLNAQLSGSDLQVWFSPTMDGEWYTQVVGRLNRPGNPKTVRIVRLIMQGTKDRAAYCVVAARQRGERATLEAFE